MNQIGIFPIKIVREQRFSGTTTLRLTGFALNGEQYAIKTIDDGALLPITEWFCYHLCSTVRIPTPGWDVIERPNGTLAFGSRIDQDTSLLGYLSPNPVFIYSILRSLASPLSRMLSLDYFLPNIDRHINNILVRQLPSNHMVALAFDWSHASDPATFAVWPWQTPNNSLSTINALKQRGDWDSNSALQTNLDIAAIPGATVRIWLDAAPIEWIPNQDPAWINQVVQSWDQARAARIHQVP